MDSPPERNTPYDHDQILAYWDREDTESMYDKHLLRLETELIVPHIASGSKVLDAGCGEGEGTVAIASIPNVVVHGVDFSSTRLGMARQRLKDFPNATFGQVDFTRPNDLKREYDVVVSQRFLINLTEWELQQSVLETLLGLVKPGGKLILLEGSQQGVDTLNDLRICFGLPAIPVKWHNLFFDDARLEAFMEGKGCQLLANDGPSAYFVLTRGIRPALDKDLNWDCEFNKLAAAARVRELLQLSPSFSRLKLWVFGTQKA